MATPTLKQVLPGYSSRSFLCGKTGSGKTVAARVFLRNLPNYHQVIIDPKGKFDYPGIVVTTPDEINDIAAESYQPIIYRPHADYIGDTDAYNGVLKWVWDRQNTTLYIDELSLIGDGRRFPRYLRAIFVAGRGLNITVLACVQRPSGIPLYCIESSENAYGFQMPMIEDRIRMSKTFHSDYMNVLPEYWFRAYNINSGGDPRLLKLPKDMI